jgi:release factor glutamine methyltransferase
MQLLLQHDRPLTEAELGAVREGVRRRARREPTHLIIGERGFFTVDLKVVPGVLLPRSDTERLVEAALQWLPKDAPAFVADIGCGSGAIGLTLAHERPQLRVYCVDLAAEALACTKDNVARLGLAERVAVLRGDLLTPIPAERPIDVVVSNPPYIPTADIAGPGRQSTTLPRTTALRCAISSLTAASTTRPTARTTATATMTIAAPTGGWKARRTIQPSARCVNA